MLSAGPHFARSQLLSVALVVSVALLWGVPMASQAAETPQSTLVNPDPADWTPQVQDGQVNAIVQMGT